MDVKELSLYVYPVTECCTYLRFPSVTGRDNNHNIKYSGKRY